MHVALLASARHPIRRPFVGGLEALTFHLARRLRARGHEVTIYASGDSDPELGVRPVVARASRLHLTDAARRDPSMVAMPFLDEHHAYLSVMLELQRSDVDLVHNHSLHYLPIAMAPALGAPVLTTLHTPPTPWIESAIGTLPRSCSNVGFVSVSTANARDWACRDRLLGVVPNGIPLDEWPYRPATAGEHVAWSGRLVPEKGPHLAIDAARRAGRELYLAGPIGDRDYYETQVRPRLGGEVTYVGHLDSDELAALVGSARVTVATPRWEEPYGLTVAESLACGTPVAAFRRGAMPEVLDERTGALADPDDVAGLAAAIDRAADLRREDCRERAERRCSIDAMAARYEDVYLALAA